MPDVGSSGGGYRAYPRDAPGEGAFRRFRVVAHRQSRCRIALAEAGRELASVCSPSAVGLACAYATSCGLRYCPPRPQRALWRTGHERRAVVARRMVAVATSGAGTLALGTRSFL